MMSFARATYNKKGISELKTEEKSRDAIAGRLRTDHLVRNSLTYKATKAWTLESRVQLLRIVEP